MRPRPFWNLKGCVLSVDDSVSNKPYSQYLAFVGHFWSGKHHRNVKGINLITLYYTDAHGHHQPINFRVYDKSENKTKNDYFKDILDEVFGVGYSWPTGDRHTAVAWTTSNGSKTISWVGSLRWKVTVWFPLKKANGRKCNNWRSLTTA